MVTQTESRFYYPLTLRRDGVEALVDAPWVVTLPLLTSSSNGVVILSEDSGKKAQGMYVWTGVRWQFALPQVEVSRAVIEGDILTVYYDQDVTTPIRDGSTVFRNGAPVVPAPTEITAGKGIWVISSPTDGTVTTVNDLSPDGRGNVTVGIANIPGLETALAEAGKVKTVNGVLPDDVGNVLVPYATESTPGTVRAELGSGLTLDNGSIAIDEALIASLGFTPEFSVYVASNGDPIDGNGKVNNPYTDITVAISQAPANSIIYIMSPGDYDGNLNLGNKALAIVGPPTAPSKPRAILTGSITLSGTNPVSIQELGVRYAGAGAALRVNRVGTSLGFSIRNFHVLSSTAATAIQIDGTDGAWLGPLAIEGLYIDDGKIAIAATAGTVSITEMPSPSNSIIEVSGGQVTITDVSKVQRIDHLGGGLYLHDILNVGVSSVSAAITSTAPAGGQNILYMNGVNTWVNQTTQAFITKTGLCPYVVTNFTRNVNPANPGNDTWAGTEVLHKVTFDKDTLITRAGVEYSGAVATTLLNHLAGIDNALGTRLKSIQGVGAGQTLVSAGNVSGAGQVKSLVNGPGVSLSSTSTTVTITNSGVLALSTVAGGTSLVNLTSGRLKSLAEGTGITFSETGGVLTVNSSVTAGVSAVNGRTGAVTIIGSGITVAPSGSNITLTNNAVMSLSTVGGAGNYSIVNTNSGQTKSLRPGTGITISDSGGVLTFDSTAVGAVTSVNSKTGAIVVGASSGIVITPTSGGFNVGNTGVHALSYLPGAGNIPLYVTTNGVLKSLKEGANISLTEAGGAITISSTVTGGVASVNAATGAITIGGGGKVQVNTVGNDVTVTTLPLVDTVNAATGDVTIVGAGATTVSTLDGVITISSAGGTAAVASVNALSGALNLTAGPGISITPNVGTGEIEIAYGSGTGSAVTAVEGLGAGTSLVASDGTIDGVAKIKGLTGVGVTVTQTSDTVTITNNGVLSVENSTAPGTELVSATGTGGTQAVVKVLTAAGITIVDSADSIALNNDAVLSVESEGIVGDGVSLVSDNGTVTKAAKVKTLTAGANVSLVSTGTDITINSLVGGGTVKSINDVPVTDFGTGNVVLTAHDVGAVQLAGDTMQGDLNMDTHKITNVPDPINLGDPVTLNYLVNSGLVIDSGTF